jgi:hypothetical protein
MNWLFCCVALLCASGAFTLLQLVLVLVGLQPLQIQAKIRGRPGFWLLACVAASAVVGLQSARWFVG